MFINRELSALIKMGAQQVPIVAVIGPRQSGKSTLLKELFKHYHYVDMQDVDLADFAKNDPKGFLNTYKNEAGLIIDEAQYAPALFAQLKVVVDQDPRPGFYILSGSQNFLLHEKISESLAGRVYFYTLLPLSTTELKSAQFLLPDLAAQVCKGFYPRVYQPIVNAQEYYQNYLSTYVERDVRTIRNIENIQTFKKFIHMCALRVGTTLNYAQLATSCGISVSTARGWLALLETSFIIFLLPAYHNNLGKRLTQSPKLYFYDVGLAAAIAGFDDSRLLEKRELFGALFENLVAVDLIKQSYAQGLRNVMTFFRDSNKNEIDLILECGGKTLPVEVKLSETMSGDFFKTAVWFAKQTESESSVVVYGGAQVQNRTQGTAIPWQQLEKVLHFLT